MPKTRDLLWFNKEGYPYNFQYDTINDKWTGKILFDENSSDTFKTIGLYIFERVAPSTITDTFDLVSLEIFNNSGLTFYGESNQDIVLTSIENVNTSSLFSSKWVYGSSIDKKLPKGSIISFSDLQGTGVYSDIIDTGITYSVLDNKPGAVLISTKTKNNYVGAYTISGGTINTKNSISIPDYEQNLLSTIEGLNLYEYDSTLDVYKKLTISGTLYNDGVYDYLSSGVSCAYISDYDISGITGTTLKLEVTLLTERPKLYIGPLNVSGVTGTLAILEFSNGLNENLTSGTTLIFEDYSGNPILSGYQYVITGNVDTEFIGSFATKFEQLKDTNRAYKYNNLIFDNDLTGYFFKNDIIILTAVTSGLLNINREFDILDVHYENSPVNKTYVELKQYVIPETGATYSYFKKLNKSQIRSVYATYSGTPVVTGYTESIGFSTSTLVNFTSPILVSGYTNSGKSYEEFIVDQFNSKNSYKMGLYGITSYYLDGNLVVESLWDYPSGGTYFTTKLYYDDVLIPNQTTYSNGSSETSKYHLYLNQKLNYERIFLNQEQDLSKPYVGELTLWIEDDILDYGFNIDFNGVNFSSSYSSSSGTTSYQYETVNNFVLKYFDAFYKTGFILSIDTYPGYDESGTTLTITGRYPNSVVFQFEPHVNIFSRFSLTETNPDCMIISGNEISGSTYNFYDASLATGMILQVDGSIYPSNNKQYNLLGVKPYSLQLSYQGPFFDQTDANLVLSTREFLRKPRGSYNKKVYYKFSWLQTVDYTSNIFFYDFSGDQLTNKGDLTYIGPTPLISETSSKMSFLNEVPNRFINHVSDPEFQQTVFESLTKELEQLDSSSDYNFVPEPLQIFIGYNSETEGVDTNVLTIQKIEYLTFSGTTCDTSGTTGFDYNNFIISGNTIEYLTNDFLFNFNTLGFETNQYISLNFKDISSKTGQTIFTNPYQYRILDVSGRKFIIDNSYYTLNYFNTSGTTYQFEIKVEPKTVAVVSLYGETETEDQRLDINLKNLGVHIVPDDVYIFKESDINDKGIDWKILNKKRKEMLINRGEIFDYVGAYKSLINAINYFGYNDLELYEYYRNIKPDSPLYMKLYKILIPDIFDNTVEGWNEYDWVKDKYNNNDYKKTNLFNLTFNITDFWGNYLEYYSVEEVQIKLVGLVKWLRKNILPLSSNIYDITGVGSVIGSIYQNYDTSNYSTKFPSEQSVTSVNYNIIQTLNHDDSYFVTLKFYVTSGSTCPEYYGVTIKTFQLDETTNMLIPVQYFDLYQVDLSPFTFEANKINDPFVYVETVCYNDYGLGYKNNKMYNFSENKNYVLVNNNFNASSYEYLYSDNKYFILLEDGNFYVVG